MPCVSIGHKPYTSNARCSGSFRCEMIHPRIERTLAGLQAGMFGGIAMLGLMMLVSLLDRRAWWSYPTLLGASFYGPRVIASGPGWPAVSGSALHLLIAGIAGAVFGAVFG